MPLRTSNARSAALVCAGLAVLGTVMTGSSLSADASAGGGLAELDGTWNGDCVTFENLTEKVIDLRYEDVPPTGPSVGDVGTFSDHLLDSRGRLVATQEGVGWDNEVRQGDGHLLGYYSETINLRGGKLRTFGQVDINAMLGGATAKIHVVGVSGRYFGMTGSREWVVISQQLATSTIVLCR
jgi:hypothetical protein